MLLCKAILFSENIINNEKFCENLKNKYTPRYQAKEHIMHSYHQIIRYTAQLIWTQEQKIKWFLVLAIGYAVLAIGINSALPLLFKQLVSYGSSLTTQKQFFMLILSSYCIMWTISQSLYPLRQLAINRIVERVIRACSKEFIAHIYQLPMTFIVDQKAGDLTSTLEQATTALPTLFYGLFFFLIPIIIEMLIAIILFFNFYGIWYSLSLTLLFIGFIMFSVFASKSRTEIRKSRNVIHAQVSSYVTDVLLNFEIIAYFGSQQQEMTNYDNLLAQREALQNKSNYAFGILYLGHSIIIGLGFLLFSLALGFDIIAGTKTIGDLVMVHGFLLQFFMPLSAFGTILRDTSRSCADMDRILTIRNHQPQSITKSLLSKTEISQASLNLSDFDHKQKIILKNHASQKSIIPAHKQSSAIIFDNVTFGYANKTPILRNVSFEIPTGTTAGLIGSTGTGKSTIVKLLFRFYDPIMGNIFINGRNIKNITRQELTNLFGIVPQDPLLFNNSIAYNISYGKPTASIETIREAAHYAQIDVTINALPDQYETFVGQQGIKFSRGERQRIALARAFIKNPPIYIFDEATASLDETTQTHVYQSFDIIGKGKTKLIITHNPASLVGVDQWLYLEMGHINVLNRLESHEKELSDII